MLLDAEKCKNGMEMGGLGVGMGVGGGMYFGVGTPSMTPQMTPWSTQNTPGYSSSVWSPGQGKSAPIQLHIHLKKMKAPKRADEYPQNIETAGA